MLPPGLAPKLSCKIFHAPFLLYLPTECSGLPRKPYVEGCGASASRTLLFTAYTLSACLEHILSHCSLGLTCCCSS